MLQWGLHITQSGDPLHKIAVEEMYRRIQKPKAAFQGRIQQLRAVRAMDEKQYRELKKELPYFVCGLFHPSVRRRENFAEIGHFLLDLDHLSQAEIPVEALAQRMHGLPEVEMCFTSPGGDGLKLMFRLGEGCRDAAMFSAFYKVFSRRFADKHNLRQVVDFATSDVSRACFVSFDPEAYYNPDATPIAMENFLPGLDFELAEKAVREAEKELPPPPAPNKEPDKDILQHIRQKLNPNARPAARAKNYHLPPELEQVAPLLAEKLAQMDMELAAANPIHYGRQLRITAGHLWAEINLFHGKRGFTVVKTTKSGSHPELADIAAQAIGQILFTLETETEDGQA